MEVMDILHWHLDMLSKVSNDAFELHCLRRPLVAVALVERCQLLDGGQLLLKLLLLCDEILALRLELVLSILQIKRDIPVFVTQQPRFTDLASSAYQSLV